MRFAVVALVALSACSRRVDHNVRAIETPSARGGGPPAMSHGDDARRRIAEARCALSEACGEADAPDACRARIEAETKIDCAVDPSRLDACVEAIRARTCTDSTAPTECAHVCKENGQ